MDRLMRNICLVGGILCLTACSGGSDDETTTVQPVPVSDTDSCVTEINGDLVLCLDPGCNNTEPIESLAEEDGKGLRAKIGGEWVINLNFCSSQTQSEDNDTTTVPAAE